ncbi:MAG TPA: SusC/RagA family TonB-linked outer membrane protein [Longimicrobium sp.]|jgi:TonB-linked SusC/RagA family outer membrane protein
MGKLRTLCASLLLALVSLPTLAQAQGRGEVTGQVTAAENGAAISGAQVRIGGTARQTVTDAAGRYRITAVEPGSYTLNVSVIGRAAGSRAVTVTAGQTTTQNFSLAASAVALEGVVVNAVTGQAERRREAGTNITSIGVADLNRGPITTVAQVLTGRTSGVTLQGTSGTTGTSQRIRIRGANSLSLSNEPLIYVDGVLATNGRGGIGFGGQSPSRLNDLNPEDIENVEVLKGPAASALYGTAAANGVLLITTRRGRAGKTTWRGYVETGRLKDPTDYPFSYTAVQFTAANPNGTLPVYNDTTGRLNTVGYSFCANESRARGLCTQNQAYRFNPLMDPRTRPFETGNRLKTGLNLSGGTQAVTYYLSVDRDEEQGVISANTLGRNNVRANLNAQVRPDLTVQVNAGYIQSQAVFNQGDNSLFSPLIGGLLGAAVYTPRLQDQAFGGPGTRPGQPFSLNTGDVTQFTTEQDLDRFIVGANGNYRPLSWLAINANTGLDFYTRYDHEDFGPDATFTPINVTYGRGYRASQRYNNYQYTANLTGVGNFDLSSALTATTTVGTSFQQQRFEGTTCYGEGSLAGTASCSATTQLFSVSETLTNDKIFGAFARQEFAFRDRLFIAASVRGDQNSGLISDFILYPAANMSWVVSEEPFFPELGFLSNLRLRAAYGESGLRPSFGQAETFFASSPVQIGGADVLAAVINQTGNANLRPERTREYEAGADLGFFEDRLSADFTYFTKRSTDALVARPLPTSLGVGASVFENLGSVRNWGTELGLNALLLDRANSRLNMRVSATTLNNKIEDLGENIAPILINRGEQAHREGFAVGGFFQIPYRYEDTNRDGRISRTEVFVDTANFNVTQRNDLTGKLDTVALQYLGPQLPTNSQSLSADLTLFKNLTISTLFERRAGHKIVNFTEYFRCASGTPALGTCAAIADTMASLDDQARYVAANLISASSRTRAGYVEDADFVKWRELSVRLGTPEALGRNLPFLRGASITLSGRNLRTWTDYTGLDPEGNETGGSNFTQGEFNTQPPVRTFSARVDLTF